MMHEQSVSMARHANSRGYDRGRRLVIMCCVSEQWRRVVRGTSRGEGGGARSDRDEKGEDQQAEDAEDHIDGLLLLEDPISPK